MSDAAALMDRMYRRQRHIYDASRKFYLLARDEAIAGLNAAPGDAIIEIGCGTGRNLAKIARAWPLASLYGVDISQEMLATASKNLRQQVMANRVRLAQGDAVRFESVALFERSKFERVFISYALSMIPQWRETLAHAVDLVAPGGSLTVVDFGDCGDLPRWFARLLQRWLALFGVTPRIGLAAELRQLSEERGFTFDCKTPFRRYAIFITLTRKPDRTMS
jgi:S-adenosylmethionine-diacylgycerolhomoserine-N-methlytransferase